MTMAGTATRLPSPSRRFPRHPPPGGLPCPHGAPSARRVGRWGCPAPTPSGSHLLASGLTRPDWQLLLPPTYSKYVHVLTPSTPPGGSPPLRCAPLRPVLQGQRLRLAGPPGAPVAPPSLRSVVRPRQCAHRPGMSLGPGDSAALVNLWGIRRKEDLPAHAGLTPLLLFTVIPAKDIPPGLDGIFRFERMIPWCAGKAVPPAGLPDRRVAT